MKTKLTLQKKYKKDALIIKKDCLPLLRHIDSRFIVDSAQILGDGEAVVNGSERAYHDIRVFLKESEIGSR